MIAYAQRCRAGERVAVTHAPSRATNNDGTNSCNNAHQPIITPHLAHQTVMLTTEDNNHGTVTSSVCGLTPSSRATTSTTMSVAQAP